MHRPPAQATMKALQRERILRADGSDGNRMAFGQCDEVAMLRWRHICALERVRGTGQLGARGTSVPEHTDRSIV